MQSEQKFLLGEKVYSGRFLGTHPGQNILKTYHGDTRLRPRCLCVPGGVPMQVTQRGERFHLARMPGTGILHAKSCPDNEDVNLFSGVSCYTPAALQTSATGDWIVRLAINTLPGLPIPAMSLNGLLDLMIETAGLHSFEPASPRPQAWSFTRSLLQSAARRMQIDGVGRLADLLLVPERYNQDGRSEMRAALEGFFASQDAETPRFVCSYLREAQQTEFGHMLTLKQLPEFRFWISGNLPDSLPLRDDADGGGLLVLAMVKQGRKAGNAKVQSIAWRRLSPRVILSANSSEDAAIEQFISQGQNFFKPLRFDAPAEVPLADFILTSKESTQPVFVLHDSAVPSRPGDYAKRLIANALRQA